MGVVVMRNPRGGRRIDKPKVSFYQLRLIPRVHSGGSAHRDAGRRSIDRTMNRALLTLIKLQARGALRRSVRGMRTVRGAMFFAVGLMVFALWLGPTLFTAVKMPRAGVDPAKVREFLPAA